ncbi:MAG: SOS response-associated peptidase family protein [Gammaproteobacteria bacterium]
MCGRFAISNPRFSRIEATLGTTFPEVRPRYNIAPSQTIPVIRGSADGGHEMVEMRWGLIPYWSKEPVPPGRAHFPIVFTDFTRASMIAAHWVEVIILELNAVRNEMCGYWHEHSPERVIIGGGTRWKKRTAQMA